MSTVLSYNITFESKRCIECGGYYLIEQSKINLCDCPYCSFRRTTEKSKIITAQDKTIAALRGAITRAKRNRR